MGAACPEERVPALLRLVRRGGRAVIPVNSDLRLYHKDGHYSVISQVRFTDLEVPSDAAVIQAHLQQRNARRLEQLLRVPDSTLAVDLAGLPFSGVDYFLAARGQAGAPADVPLCDAVLAPEDGSWSLPVHRVVLERRCPQIRARVQSGMQDSDVSLVTVPEGFPQEAAEELREYLYEERVSEHSPNGVAALCHLASYFGVDRLVRICEGILASELQGFDQPHGGGKAGPEPAGAELEEGDEDPFTRACELAPQLLVLAEELGLAGLELACLDFMSLHWSYVQQAESFEVLTRAHLAKALGYASNSIQETMAQIRRLAPQHGHYPPSVGDRGDTFRIILEGGRPGLAG